MMTVTRLFELILGSDGKDVVKEAAPQLQG